MLARLRIWYRAAAVTPERGATDGALVRRFAEYRDEVAFGELVRRHGPMVLAACRRVLHPDAHTAEDAFQATFLVLATKAGAVSPPDRVGAWLHGVAVRVAQKAKARAHKLVPADPFDLDRVAAPFGADPSDAVELRAQLDSVLAGLPAKYRAVVVLCELEGRSRAEAAGMLGCAEGTLSSRLARARKLLAGRLARRGVTAPAAGLGVALPASALASVPEQLAASTLRAAALVAAGTDAGAAVPAAVFALAQGIPMHTNAFKVFAGSLIAAAVAIGAFGLYAITAAPAPPSGPLVEATTPAPIEKRWVTIYPIEHTAAITAVAVGPEFVATGDKSGLIVLSDGKTGAKKESFPGIAQRIDTDKGIDHLRFSADGTTLLAVTGANSVHRIPLKGNIVSFDGQDFEPGDWRTVGTATDGAGWVHTSRKKSAAALSPNPGAEGWFKSFLGTQFVHKDTVTHAATAQGRGAALATVAGVTRPVLRHWSKARAAPLWETALGEITVTGVIVSPDGKVIAVTGAAGEVRVFDAKSGKLVTTAGASAGAVRAADFSPDGKWITAGYEDKIARVFDCETGKEVAALKGHTGAVTAVAFGPDGNTLATGSDDKTVRVWDSRSPAAQPARKNEADSKAEDVSGPVAPRKLPDPRQGFAKATVEAWEKRGFEARWVRLHTFGWYTTTDPGTDGDAILALSYRDSVPPLTNAGLKDLPPVEVPFALMLWRARVSDAGLEHLAGLKNLTHLCLKGTNVTGTGLKHLAGLPNLTALELSQSRITDEGMAHLAGLKNLTRLTINYIDIIAGQLNGTGLKHLAGLENFTTLDLNNTQVTDEGLEAIAGIGGLKHLALNRAFEITDEGLKHLAKLKNLSTLVLDQTQITGNGVKHLAGLTNLTALDLSMTQMTDEGLAHLAGLKNLSSLNLYNATKVTGDGVKHLAGLSNLTALDLRGAKITHDGFKHLAGLKKLTSIKISGSPVTDAGLSHLTGLKSLATLDLLGAELTDEGLKHLAGLTNLSDLSLYNTRVTSEGLRHLAGLKNLTVLNLTSTDVTDEGLKHLAELNNLVTLNLPYKVAGPGLKHLAGLKRLTTLELGSAITDESLRALHEIGALHCLPQAQGGNRTRPTRADEIVTLDLSQASLKGDGLKYVATLKNLTDLILRDAQVSDAGLEDLRRALPKCKVFR